MIRIILNVILFLISITFFSYVYIYIFKVPLYVIFIILLIFVVYGFIMGLGRKSIRELKKYEQKLIHFGLNEKDEAKILLFSLTALSPTYLCVILVSSVPLYTYEAWFITAFPCIILNCIPASSILDEYYGLAGKRSPFLTLFCFAIFLCCIIGVIVASFMLKMI